MIEGGADLCCAERTLRAVLVFPGDDRAFRRGEVELDLLDRGGGETRGHACADGSEDPVAAALIRDEVQTRRNDRSLVTDAGVTVKNRHRWIIESVGPDGSVTVADHDRGRVTLLRDYVDDALTLGYASTAMAGQGRTVDHSLVLVDGPIDAAGLYVPMTRGREGNEVWVVVDPTSPGDAVDVLADVMQRRWVDEPAIDSLPAAEIGLD